MKRQAFVKFLVLAAVIVASAAHADPILKPRKYFGPIPQNSISVRVGFLGGADNAEMIKFLDSDKTPPEMAISDDFGNALSFDVTYMFKPHPQFAVRANASVALLRSTGEGFFIGDTIEFPDTTRPQIDYTRKFDVDLFTFEASGVYFFSDAAVKEFQPYFGAGFTLGIPHAKFNEQRLKHRDSEPQPVPEEIVNDKWSTEAGVHALLGAFYYVTNRFALSVEGRLQLLESKYSLETINEFGEPEEVRFDVSYTGFYLMIGVARGF